MIVNMCAFEGLAAYYNLYHNGGLEQANEEGRQEHEARKLFTIMSQQIKVDTIF